jgi:hypothetical protein
MASFKFDGARLVNQYGSVVASVVNDRIFDAD